jgi:hypothetical protein
VLDRALLIGEKEEDVHAGNATVAVWARLWARA